MIKELLVISSLISLNYNNVKTTESINECAETSNVLSFNLIGKTNITTIIDYKDGFSTYYIEIYKMDVDQSSNLLLIKSHTEFVPGVVADTYDSKYDGGRNLGLAYVAMQPVRYVNESTNAYGPELETLLTGPDNNNTFTTTVSNSSSFNVSIEGSYEIGNGLELDVKKGINGGVQFEFSSSVATEITDPLLSTFWGQKENYKDRVWSAEVVNVSAVGKKVYTLDTYMLLRTKLNTITNANEDAFILKYTAKMRCKYNFLGWKNGSLEEYNVAISCFL